MATEGTAPQPKDGFKIAMPVQYDGDIEKSRRWLNSVLAFMEAKKDDYNTSERKIIFTLSLMIEGTAASWAKNKYDEAHERIYKEDRITFDCYKGYGEWTDFEDDFRKSFSYLENEVIARGKLRSLRQGNNSVDE